MKYITEEGRKYFNEARELQLDEKISLKGMGSRLLGATTARMKELNRKRKERGFTLKGAKKKKEDVKTRFLGDVVLDDKGEPVLDDDGKPKRDPTTRQKRTKKGLKMAAGAVDDVLKGHEEPIKQGLKGINPDSQGYEPIRGGKPGKKKYTAQELKDLQDAGLFGGDMPGKDPKKVPRGPNKINPPTKKVDPNQGELDF